ncbi:hypothetical protein [Fodinicurvata sediminis]|uniref:hypothetical protein n=1 Tax=Fodinicurvata sediminis TaxID=1121832 RepID=UPI0003B4FABB|nr:hypothetical protein [Fodinicurvata sediminis]
MIGVPRVLRTRQDYENVRAGVLEGRYGAQERARALAHWQALLSRHRYVFDRELAEGEAPDGPEPDYTVLVLRDEETDAVTARQQRVRIEDPKARIFKLGYSVPEVEAAISDMEGVINGAG